MTDQRAPSSLWKKLKAKNLELIELLEKHPKMRPPGLDLEGLKELNVKYDAIIKKAEKRENRNG